MSDEMVWGDTFDDGMRAAASLLIDCSRQQPWWMPWWGRRQLRRGAYPWAFWVVEQARVNRHLAPGVSVDTKVIQKI